MLSVHFNALQYMKCSISLIVLCAIINGRSETCTDKSNNNYNYLVYHTLTITEQS